MVTVLRNSFVIPIAVPLDVHFYIHYTPTPFCTVLYQLSEDIQDDKNMQQDLLKGELMLRQRGRSTLSSARSVLHIALHIRYTVDDATREM